MRQLFSIISTRDLNGIIPKLSIVISSTKYCLRFYLRLKLIDYKNTKIIKWKLTNYHSTGWIECSYLCTLRLIVHRQ